MLLEEQRREECEQQLATASSDGRELHVKVRCASCEGTTPLWGVHVHAAAVCSKKPSCYCCTHPTAPVSTLLCTLTLLSVICACIRSLCDARTEHERQHPRTNVHWTHSPPPPTPHTHLWWSVRCAPLRVVVLRYPVWSMSWTWHVLSCRRLTLLPSRHPNGRARCVPGQGRMLSLLAFAVLISPHMFNSARFVGTTEGGGRGRGVARA
jgi:hypothetical protein